MSDLGLLAFISFFIVQILLPLRRYFTSFLLKSGNRDILVSEHCLFSWTMKQSLRQGDIYFIVYLRDTDKEVGIFKPEDFLLPDQVRFLACCPSAALQFVKFLEKILEDESEGPIDHLGIKAFSVLDINQRGAKVMIDEERDLRLEPTHCLRSYDWLIHH